MRTLPVAIGFASLGVLVLAARSARSDGPERDMTIAHITSRSPAIDQRAPARTETATFALG